MQLNVSLSEQSHEQAKLLRAAYYPGKSPQQIRESYLFSECISNFSDDINVLSPYIDNELPCSTIQRMLSIKHEALERLQTIAAALNASQAATYRAIIAYSVDHINDSMDKPKNDLENTQKNAQLLTAKIALLGARLSECNEIMAEIKALMN